MQRSIDYWFTLVSPWAALGHAQFVDIAQKHNAAIVYRPVSLGTVFPNSGGLPLAQRHPLRQQYRMVELQRWIAARNSTMKTKPKFWPLDPSLLDQIVIALAQDGKDVEAFLPRAFNAIFSEERDMKDAAVVSAVLGESGLDAASVLASAQSDKVKAIYRSSADAALQNGVFGSPAYVLNGEVFWGQDRLGLLDDALTSGRAPFEATV